jgi:hypothetical protein
MTARDFCYWLQGLFELGDPPTLDEKQTDLIKRHLNLVFVHEIDPSHSDDPKVQGALQAVHDGVDVNELRGQLEKLENFDPEALDKKVEEAAAVAKKALNRQIPRSRGETRYMC